MITLCIFLNLFFILYFFLFIVTLHRNLQNRLNLACFLQSVYLHWRINQRLCKKWEVTQKQIIIFIIPAWFSNQLSPSLGLAHFSSQEQRGRSRSGSWWSLAVTGWSWARRWPCTSSRSSCTGWDSQCSPAASFSHCRQKIKDGDKVEREKGRMSVGIV